MYWPSNDTRSKAADFQDNLVKPVPECQATVDFSAATDDGNGCIVTTGTLTDSKLQSEHHYQNTNTPSFSQSKRSSCRPANNAKAPTGLHCVANRK